MDTNVIYAGLYSSKGASFRVLKAIMENKIIMALSTTLLFEYEEVLKRNMSVLNLSETEIDKILDYFCLQGEHYRVNFLWRPYLPDPKDDHILELAFSSGVKFIITHNHRDFRGAEEFNVRAISPKQLMEGISWGR